MPLTDLRARLVALGDPAIAEHSQRFFKTAAGEYGAGDLFRGIRVPPLRSLAKEFGQISLVDAGKLLESKHHEDRLCALFILVQQFKEANKQERKEIKAKATPITRAPQKSTCEEIYSLYLNKTAFINNWDLVDSSAEHIVGGFLADKNRKPLYALVKSSSLWERRIAVMATFHFIRRNDFDDALQLIDLLLHDAEDLIHKAAGWMLREVGNRDQAAAELFLKSRYTTMPRTMLRYAVEKYPEKRRQEYLQGKA